MHRGEGVGGTNHTTILPCLVNADIKPSNVLVNTHGQVKLCDFGVSVQLLTSLTKTFIGTNAYMAVRIEFACVRTLSIHFLCSLRGSWEESMGSTRRYGVLGLQF